MQRFSGPSAQPRILMFTSSSSVPTHRVPADDHILMSVPPCPTLTHKLRGQQQQRRPALRLALPQHPEEEVVVSRRGRGGLTRLESPPPINRYAGDWSTCGRDLLSAQEADYDEVAGSDSDGGKQTSRTLTMFDLLAPSFVFSNIPVWMSPTQRLHRDQVRDRYLNTC